MTTIEIAKQLQKIANADDFAAESAALTEAWLLSQVGLDAIEPILRFMEENRDIDFGVPGALVHFVERFYEKGYEQKLIDSIHSKPTPHTVWMLNRIINGTNSPERKQDFVGELARLLSHPLADVATRRVTEFFLNHHRRE
jgi:hypothetical protein